MTDGPQPRVVCLTSILFTHRMLMHTGFLPRLAQGARPVVWTTTIGNPDFDQEAAALPDGWFEPLPSVSPMRHALVLLRRMNEAAWDRHAPYESRKSFHELRRKATESRQLRMTRAIGSAAGALGMHAVLERMLTPLWLRHDRSPEAMARLRADLPAALLSTSPFRLPEPGIVAAAKRLDVPTIAFITSWDNLSTKNRMLFDYDAYIVWTERMKDELLTLYPHARDVPVHVVGAPQFDVFMDPRFGEPRERFLSRYGLDPAKPVILYALGSPGLLREHHGAIALARRLVAGDLGDVQMLVRPHPLHPIDPEALELETFGPRVALQRLDERLGEGEHRFQSADEITAWVSTFRHADVVVNLSSTAAIDASIVDRPVVNLDHDPEPGQPNARLVHDINHRWAHFSPIAASGGVALTRDLDETVAAVNRYLADPSLDAEGRRWIASYVAGPCDGRAGERMADAVLSVVQSSARARVRA